MDKSKKYIEMSLAAIPCFGVKPPDPTDFIALETTVGSGKFDVISGLQFWQRLGPNVDPVTTNRQWVKLRRQDELQEMIIDDFDDVQDMFYTFDCWLYEKPYKTAEQLWLAFLMKLEYNKTWDGKDWVNAS